MGVGIVSEALLGGAVLGRTTVHLAQPLLTVSAHVPR